MNTVVDVIETLGGVRHLARLLSYPVSTVQNWKVRGKIPPVHFPMLEQIATDAGKSLPMHVLLSAYFQKNKNSRKRRR